MRQARGPLESPLPQQSVASSGGMWGFVRMWVLIPAGPHLTWEGSTASVSRGRHTLSFPFLACVTTVSGTPGPRLPPKSGPRSHKITVTLKRTWLLVPAQLQRLPWYLALCMQKQAMRVHLVGICCQLSQSTTPLWGQGVLDHCSQP